MENLESRNFEPLVIVSNALTGGGAEKTMLALHKEFIKQGIDCNLIALNQSTQVDGIKNIKILNRNWGGSLKTTLLNFLNFRDLITSINPKTIIVNCELPELYVSLLNFYKVRIICVEHTSVPWRKKRFLGAIVRLLLRFRKVEWVTVVNGTKDIWFGKNNPKYIPNPFIGGENSAKVSNFKPSLVFIGGLKENKRPNWVIEAGVRNNLPVHLYGVGKLKFNLEAKYVNSAQNIHFHGFKSNVWDLIPSNSLVVVPSEFEGDGMVIIESIITGFPLVLAWNKDLIRFGLDDKHYFKTLNELIFLVEKNKENQFKNLIVGDEFIKNLSKQRSLELIVLQWQSLLNKKNSIMNI
jgi:hypothetical protein